LPRRREEAGDAAPKRGLDFTGDNGVYWRFDMKSQGNPPAALLALSFAAGALFAVGGAVTLSFLAGLASRRTAAPRRTEEEPRPRFLLSAPSVN
jgi:hypothetical protein